MFSVRSEAVGCLILLGVLFVLQVYLEPFEHSDNLKMLIGPQFMENKIALPDLHSGQDKTPSTPQKPVEGKTEEILGRIQERGGPPSNHFFIIFTIHEASVESGFKIISAPWTALYRRIVL